MLNLIKADLFKLKKEKSIYVMAIVILAYAVISMILYQFMTASENTEILATNVMVENLYPFQNISIIIPIIIAIYICKDFGFGTIRNKIIIGKSKTKIYIANIIEGVILGLCLYLFNVLVQTLLTGIFFSFGDFTASFFFKSLIMGIFLFTVMLSFITAASMVIHSLGLSILAFFIFFIALSMLSMIDIFKNSVVETISSLLTVNQAGVLMFAAEEGIKISDLIKTIISSTVYSGTILTIAGAIFVKRDLK